MIQDLKRKSGENPGMGVGVPVFFVSRSECASTAPH